MTLPDMDNRRKTALFIPSRKVIARGSRERIEQCFTLAAEWCVGQGCDTFICRGTEVLDYKFMSGVINFRTRNHPEIRLLVYQFYENERRESIFHTGEGKQLLSQVDFMTHVFDAPVTRPRTLYARELVRRASVVISAIPELSLMNTIVVQQCRIAGVPLFEAVSGRVLHPDKLEGCK